MQYVRIGNCFSDKRLISMGVPQGSILGPLFFLLYVNDFPNLSELFHPTLFADDTNITISDSSPATLTIKCNDILNKIFDWTVSNRLTLNYDKTYYMTIINQTSSALTNPIFLNGHTLNDEITGKFLGIVMDNKLKFNHHINHICNKISKTIGIIHRLKYLLPKHCLFSLFYSFIHPYVTYCNLIWGGTYNCHLHSLNILHKRAIRLINNQPFLAHTASLYHSSNILNLHDTHRYFLSIYMYKNRNSLTYNRNHHYNTRLRQNLLPSFRRLTSTQHSLSYTAPTVWNNLPDEVKNSETLPIFKHRAKKYFISLYNQ